MWTLLARGAARHCYRRHRRRVCPSEERRQNYSAALLRDLLQHVAAVRDRADRDHNQPRLKWIEVEPSVLLIGKNRQNDRRQQKELGERQNFLRSRAVRKMLEKSLQFEQQQAGDAQRGRNPQVVVEDERSDNIDRQARHLRRDACGFGARKFVPVGKKQKCADNKKPENHRNELRARQKRDRVAKQSDQRKRADSPEGIGSGGGLVFLALKADQERKKKDENDFENVGRKNVVKVHGLGSG